MRKFILIIILIYIGVFGVLWLGRFTAIYPFDPTYVTTADAGIPQMRAQKIRSFDDTQLVVWTKQPRGRQPTIVYFHGNAGNLASRAQRFDRMIKRGYGIIAMAYRGSSGSDGAPSQQLIMKDSQFLIENINLLGFRKNQKLIFYGESLGTGVATQLAVTNPPNALILEAPFTSITDLAAKQFPIFPIRYVLDQNWNSLDAIKQIDVPLLVIHGRDDRLIPFSHAQSIFESSKSAQKTIKIMQNTSHSNIWSINGQKFIYKFIDSI